MSPLLITFFCLGVLLLGYRFYSRFLSKQIFSLSDDEKMPSVLYEDGIDFVPTDKHILFGHHFSSIAGAAPILGPAMAIVWGFVPALIWIVLGVVFMGAAHDFGALVLSMRHDGKSVGTLAEHFIGPRSRMLFLWVIFFLIWMVGAVFAFAIGGLFIKFPASILPVNLEIIVAMAMGWWATKKGRSLTLPSLLALVGLYVVIFASAQGLLPQPSSASLLLDIRFWLVALLFYAFIASSLPVWLLLQPRDLINSHQLIVGLLALYIGFFLSEPSFSAPAVGELSALPAVFPLLFVTIACGAISGFHGLVSSGTTSKQLYCAKDARPVGYGSMLMEASLAILATLAVATGVMSDGSTPVFEKIYAPFIEEGSLPSVPQALGGFVQGAASMLEALGIPFDVGATVVAVLVISFAATSLDTALRIQRMVLAEVGEILFIKPLQNRWIGGALACSSVGLLIWADFSQRAKSLWPVFGATNQVLAAVTLAICAIYLKRIQKNARPYWVPAVVIMVITFVAMGMQVYRDVQGGNMLVAGVGAVIAVLSMWIAAEAFKAWRKAGHDLSVS